MIMVMNPVSHSTGFRCGCNRFCGDRSSASIGTGLCHLGHRRAGSRTGRRYGHIRTTIDGFGYPDLQFAVAEAQAALHSAQAYADLQKYQKVKDQRNGKIFYDTLPEIYRQRADARVQQAQIELEIAQINFAEAN